MKRSLPVALLLTCAAGWSIAARAADAFPADWFFPDRPQEVVELEGKALPKLDYSKMAWSGGKAPAEKELDGKILVIDVWATWCGPCRRALPHNVELTKEHAKDGVVVLGICASGSAKEMEEIQKKAGVDYPAAFAGESEKELERQLHTPWFPYYLVVDRKGVVRGAALSHDGAAKAVEALLKEQPAEKK